MDKMKFKSSSIEGTVVKNDDRYIVKDNTTLKNLVVSSTRLNPRKSTTCKTYFQCYLLPSNTQTKYNSSLPACTR